MARCGNCGDYKMGALGDYDIIDDGISVFPYAWGHYGGLWDYFPQDGDTPATTVHMCKECALSLFRAFPVLAQALPSWVQDILKQEEAQ